LFSVVGFLLRKFLAAARTAGLFIIAMADESYAAWSSTWVFLDFNFPIGTSLQDTALSERIPYGDSAGLPKTTK
jgi:hypothetical protein